jgi:WD40 repeat protein
VPPPVSTQVRLYEVNAQGQSQAKALHKHEGPVLDICWTTVRLLPEPVWLLLLGLRRPRYAGRCGLHLRRRRQGRSGLRPRLRPVAYVRPRLACADWQLTSDPFAALTGQVAGHDLPIRSVRYSTASSGSAYLMTGGWDKQLRYWDLRTRAHGSCLSSHLSRIEG